MKFPRLPFFIQAYNGLSAEGNTDDSRYLELGYLEFCETRSVYLDQKYILIAFSNHNLTLKTVLQVQINLNFG